MRTSLTLLLIAVTASLTAQEPVSQPRDKEIEEIMARVEGKESKPKFEIIYEIEGHNENEKSMIAALDRYLNYLAESDIQASYAMLWSGYRKAVRFSDHAKKDAVEPHIARVTRAWYEGDCALFRGTLKADTGTAMGVMRIPLKIHIFKEEGEWRVYQNPYEVGGFMNPKGRQIKPPCSFYDEDDDGRGN